MNRDQLHHILRQLDDELRRTKPLDEKTRDLLRDLSQDIQSVLNTARTQARQAHYDSLGNRLSGALKHFEAAHPALARTTAHLVDTLALFNL